MPIIEDGVYRVKNVKSGTFLDLEAGNESNGAVVKGYPSTSNIPYYNACWLVTKTKDYNNKEAYTLRNIKSGTWLFLGGSKLHELILCWQDRFKYAVDTEKTSWNIEKTSDGKYVLRNAHYSTRVIDLKDGNSAKSTPIQAWELCDNNDNQRWQFEKISVSSEEVNAKIHNSPHKDSDFKSYLTDGTYIVLSDELRNEIWKESGLPDRKWRSQIFDCDDYAFVMKSAVAKWGDKNLHCTDFALLCGIAFGRRKTGSGAHAYNWHLDSSLNDIVFYEPQTGETTSTSDYNMYVGIY